MRIIDEMPDGPLLRSDGTRYDTITPDQRKRWSESAKKRLEKCPSRASAPSEGIEIYDLKKKITA